jgi:iron-sulfur cluster assembly protein
MNTLVQIRGHKAESALTIEVSNRARSELRRLGVAGGQFMRIGVAAGGCAGSTYAATLDNELSASDRVLYEDDDVRIVADGEDATKLAGLHIDYSDDLVAPGFRLTNTNAKRACGCGSSFSM